MADIGWKWEELAHLLPLSSLVLLAAQSVNPNAAQQDRVMWSRLGAEGVTVRQVYKELDHTTSVTPWPGWKIIWQLQVQKRIRTFMWLVSCDRLLTNWSRWRRKLVQHPTCWLCGDDAETVIHVLRDCSQAKQVWASFVPNQYRVSFFSLPLMEWISYNLIEHEIGRRIPNWRRRFVITCWFLWRWRNDRLFNDQDWPLFIKLQRVRAEEQHHSSAWERLNRVQCISGHNFSPQVIMNH